MPLEHLLQSLSTAPPQATAPLTHADQLNALRTHMAGESELTRQFHQAAAKALASAITVAKSHASDGNTTMALAVAQYEFLRVIAQDEFFFVEAKDTEAEAGS
jgi:hypothetical protein